MHSILQRLNTVSAFFSTCLFALLGCIALTTYLLETHPQGTLEITSTKVKSGRMRNRLTETAHVKFQFDGDLTSLFHWNTKQVFLYLSTEYTSASGTQNEVVFWDRIVRRKQDANIHVAGSNKYFIKDVNRSFKNATAATYSMKYNVMPWVGPLTYGVAAKTEPLALPPAENKV